MPRAHLHKSKGRKGGGKAAWRKGKARKQKNKGPPTAKEKKAAAAKIQAEIRRKQAQVKEIERRRAEQKAEEKAAFLERQRRLSAPPARPKTSGAAREFMHTIEDNLEEAELRMEEIRQKFEQVDKNNSNTICKAEACHILETLGMVEGDVSFDELLDMFDSHDIGGLACGSADGELDFDELVQFHNPAITLRADDAGGEYRRGQFDRHAEVPETKAQSIDF